jgi:hypothetical protein
VKKERVDLPSVCLRFSGPVRRPWPEASRPVPVDVGWTVRDLLLASGFAEGELGFLHTAVNDTTADLTTPLADGDSVDVMLRVGGG